MRILPLANNLIGKLVYFYNPVFKINKLLDSCNDLTEKLEEIANLKLSDPIIEEVNPTKVLGKVHPTLRYEFAIFQNKSYDILNKIGIGFGEKGYYYDFYLKFEDGVNNFEESKILPLLDEAKMISHKIEHELEEFYLMEPKNERRIEVSNFSMNIEFQSSIESLFNPFIVNELNTLTEASEEIINDIKNKSSFNFKITFFPRIAEEGPVLTSREIIITDRTVMFTRDLSRPKQFLYNVKMRGVPAINCLNFIKRIEEVIK